MTKQKNIYLGDIQYLRDLIINKVIGRAQSFKVDNKYETFKNLNQIMIDEESDDLNFYDNLLHSKKKEKDVVLRAFTFFAKYFKKLSIDQVRAFNRQFLKTRVVTISSLQEEEVYNIFEILNARGVKLKQSELLKNYMFKYLKPKQLLDTYKDKWKSLEEILENVDIDDYYFHVFRCWHYKNKMQKDQLFESTKECLNVNNQSRLPDFFDFFVDCGKVYKRICDADAVGIEKEVYEYFKLKTNKQIRPIILMLRLKFDNNIIDELLYYRLIIYIRNFFVIFNLDSNTSNKIDNDVNILANKLFISESSCDVEYCVLKFLLKFSVYFKENIVLENGLKNIAYSNRSTRKNITSRLLVYLFKPLILSVEENKFAQYDFSKFNVEHILNDSDDENILYSLGNLLSCPEELNFNMKNKTFVVKRDMLNSSGISYLKGFANMYEKFEKDDIIKRTEVLNKDFLKFYGLSYTELNNRYEKLEIQKALGEQLIQSFGHSNTYIQRLYEMGVDKFIEFIYKNGALPQKDVDTIKPLINKIAI